MEKALGKEYPLEERIQFLKDNCDKIETKSYMKRFTQDEILQKKEELSETSIQINDWAPSELGMYFKMNRAFFESKDDNMKLVTDLMNFKASVDNKIERSMKENGDRKDNFAQIVNSNLPKSFKLKIPIFKARQPEIIEVETFAQINGRDVAFTLLSPGAQETLENIRDNEVDLQLKKIRELAPDIAIIEQ